MPHDDSMHNQTLISILRRHISIMILGFGSGLPLALTGQTMQAWLTAEKIDISTIGFFGLVATPYALKFLWAPLMDRFEPPFGGRRRGWLMITQIALAITLLQLSSTSPQTQSSLFALLACITAFLSASQDVVFDAYRTDLLPKEERGIGTSLSVLGYRLAMILSGGIAFIWAEQWGDWASVYKVISFIFIGIALTTMLIAPSIPIINQQQAPMSDELKGFLALFFSVVAGFYVTRELLTVGYDTYSAVITATTSTPSPLIKLLFLSIQIFVAASCAYLSTRRVRFPTLENSFANFFLKPNALLFLSLIVLYKLGDAFAGSLSTNFLLNEMQFSSAEVGFVNKIIGMWMTIIGALIGGAALIKLGLYRSLFLFGLLQLFSNFGYFFLAAIGKGALGSITLAPFNIIVASLDHSIEIDYLLGLVVFTENICGGMGTAAFIALLMALCNKQFSATQFALLSALASIGRILASPIAGVLAPSIGWPNFFLASIIVAIPGMLMVWYLRSHIKSLDD